MPDYKFPGIGGSANLPRVDIGKNPSGQTNLPTIDVGQDRAKDLEVVIKYAARVASSRVGVFCRAQ